MSDTLIKVEGVSKKFCRSLKRSLWYGMQDLGRELLGKRHGGDGELRKDEFWAIKDVSFEVKRGECVALLGHNGAGKTTLLRLLNGLIKPDKGRIEIQGRVGALIALGAGFNPLLTGRENILVNAGINGVPAKQIHEKTDEIITFSELDDFIDSPVCSYSSGMNARLSFAIATAVQPEVLLVDEALAVGDIAFVTKCINRIAELRNQGTSVVFVSHNELQVRWAAERAIVMQKGSIKCDGDLTSAFHAYHTSMAPPLLDTPIDSGFVLDGPVRIRTCQITNLHRDKPVATGESIEIQLSVESDEAISDVQLEIRIWGIQGQVITSIHPESDGEKITLTKGPNYLSIHVQSLLLSPGVYRAAGGFRNFGKVLGWTRDLAQFEVTPPANRSIREGFFVTFASIRRVNKLYV